MLNRCNYIFSNDIHINICSYENDIDGNKSYSKTEFKNLDSQSRVLGKA